MEYYRVCRNSAVSMKDYGENVFKRLLNKNAGRDTLPAILIYLSLRFVKPRAIITSPKIPRVAGAGTSVGIADISA